MIDEQKYFLNENYKGESYKKNYTLGEFLFWFVEQNSKIVFFGVFSEGGY